ncbi:hypothetical protein BGX34_005924 [Mortierella sp. NVP85]|nr:hypothetical protein BGX34_005924 [Mortierella sp. NVP85]
MLKSHSRRKRIAPDKTIVIGCDPGVQNALAFSKLKPAHPTDRETFKVAGYFLNVTYTQFRHLFQRRKNERELAELESDIPAFRRDSFDQLFRYLRGSPDENAYPRLTQLTFLWTPINVEKRWDLRKEQTSTYGYVVQRLLRMMEGEPDQKAVLSVGLGSFNGITEMPSNYTSVIKLIFTRAVSSRFKYCRSCKVYLDRDVVGSENLARICETQLINQRRLVEFMPEAEAGGPKQKRKRQPAAQGTKRKHQFEQEFKPKRQRQPEPEGSRRKPKRCEGEKRQ